MLNPLDLTGRRILVTGASSGIGRATAVLLSQLGAELLITGRSQERLEETRSQLQGNCHHVIAADLIDVADIPAWMKEVVASTGPLHGLVHSAGVHSVRPLKLLDLGQLQQTMHLNLTVAIALAKGFRQRQVRGDSGSLVFLASVMGLVAQPGVTAYCASKGALIAAGRALALELAPEKIRVNTIAPGQVETEMTERQRATLPEEHFEAIRKMHPLGLGTTTDVANAIAFLLSDASRWITGTSLVVDGGYTAH